jgi:oligopeptide transport system ATP-binding protein
MSFDTLVRVEKLTKHFPISRGIIFRRQVESVRAVDGVTFGIRKGETLGLVGESGCGKTTVGRTIVQLYRPTSGHVYYRDLDLAGLRGAELRRIRRNIQMVFQDPYASLNPRWTVRAIISEPLVAYKLGGKPERERRVRELLQLVGLNPNLVDRYPHEFSGGQQQRIGVARALAAQPEFIVLDEPISALDVSVQAQVVNLLEDLQEKLGLTYLFIAHDLSMVRHISDRTAVMYLGKIVEMAPRDELYNHPLHPYTKALLSAVPIPNPRKERQREKIILKGSVPSPINPPPGCRFHPRCPLAVAQCSSVEPEWYEISTDHWVACHVVKHAG